MPSLMVRQNSRMEAPWHETRAWTYWLLRGLAVYHWWLCLVHTEITIPIFPFSGLQVQNEKAYRAAVTLVAIELLCYITLM